MLLVLVGTNTLHSTRFTMDSLFSEAFDDKNWNLTRFDDPQIKEFGARVATVNIILSLLTCSIVLVDEEECINKKLINAKIFKHAFASIQSTPKYLFVSHCMVLCKCYDFCKSHVHFTCNT